MTGDTPIVGGVSPQLPFEPDQQQQRQRQQPALGGGDPPKMPFGTGGLVHAADTSFGGGSPQMTFGLGAGEEVGGVALGDFPLMM